VCPLDVVRGREHAGQGRRVTDVPLELPFGPSFPRLCEVAFRRRAKRPPACAGGLLSRVVPRYRLDPVSATLTGLLVALLLMTNVPVCEPAAVGA
jgi:hypothetical protein